MENFSVDDLLASFSTVAEAKQIVNDLVTMLGRVGFKLHKFQSNSEEFMKEIPLELCAKEKAKNLSPDKYDDEPVEEGEQVMPKVLGVQWSHKDDSWVFPLCPPVPEGDLTSRRLLSLIARIYDPTGHVAPSTLTL